MLPDRSLASVIVEGFVHGLSFWIHILAFFDTYMITLGNSIRESRPGQNIKWRKSGNTRHCSVACWPMESETVQNVGPIAGEEKAFNVVLGPRRHGELLLLLASQLTLL